MNGDALKKRARTKPSNVIHFHKWLNDRSDPMDLVWQAWCVWLPTVAITYILLGLGYYTACALILCLGIIGIIDRCIGAWRILSRNKSEV